MKFYKQSTAPAQGKRTQREDLHGSGVYPSSGPWPEHNAPLRTPEDWNERAIGPAEQSKAEETKADEAIKEKARRARQGVRRRIKSDLDEGYSQGQDVTKHGNVEQAIRTT